ncbi:MAG: two pore domain potassium channel family protein [Planctomycetes bacterium]|nr:two pore domain potassium channel family protein [Planctomycetota bacterium]
MYQAYRRNRFKVLLAALVLLMVATPGSQVLDSTTFARFVVNFSIIVMLLFAALAVSSSRVRTTIAVLLVVPVIGFEIADLFIGAEGSPLVESTIAVIAITYIVALMLEHLFRADRISADTIAASLCVYLLLGVMWAWAYSVLELVRPDSFHYAFQESGEELPLRFGGAGSSNALYYSFVTMTTLGYGDIVPANAGARMLAAFQAVIGQVYLAVLVARLVGLHIATRAAEAAEARRR